MKGVSHQIGVAACSEIFSSPDKSLSSGLPRSSTKVKDLVKNRLERADRPEPTVEAASAGAASAGGASSSGIPVKAPPAKVMPAYKAPPTSEPFYAPEGVKYDTSKAPQKPKTTLRSTRTTASVP